MYARQILGEAFCSIDTQHNMMEWIKKGNHTSDGNNNNNIKGLGRSLRSLIPICGSRKDYNLEKYIIKRFLHFVVHNV